VATVEKQLREESRNVVGELLDRQPPRSMEAERAVIGSLLLLPQACDEVALLVRPEDFYDSVHRTIFRHMLDLHDDGQRRSWRRGYATRGNTRWSAARRICLSWARRWPRRPMRNITPASFATRPC
jgi:hypothetical protein